MNILENCCEADRCVRICHVNKNQAAAALPARPRAKIVVAPPPPKPTPHMVATADVPPCAAMPSREGAAPRDRPLRSVGKVRRRSPRHVAVACARLARLQLRYLRTHVQGACWASSARGEAGARPGGQVRTPAAGEASVLCQ